MDFQRLSPLAWGGEDMHRVQLILKESQTSPRKSASVLHTPLVSDQLIKINCSHKFSLEAIQPKDSCLNCQGQEYQIIAFFLHSSCQCFREKQSSPQPPSPEDEILSIFPSKSSLLDLGSVFLPSFSYSTQSSSTLKHPRQKEMLLLAGLLHLPQGEQSCSCTSCAFPVTAWCCLLRTSL